MSKLVDKELKEIEDAMNTFLSFFENYNSEEVEEDEEDEVINEDNVDDYYKCFADSLYDGDIELTDVKLTNNEDSCIAEDCDCGEHEDYCKCNFTIRQVYDAVSKYKEFIEGAYHAVYADATILYILNGVLLEVEVEDGDNNLRIIEETIHFFKQFGANIKLIVNKVNFDIYSEITNVEFILLVK